MDNMTLERDREEGETEVRIFCAWCMTKEKIDGFWQIVPKDIAIALRNISSHGICSWCASEQNEKFNKGRVA